MLTQLCGGEYQPRKPIRINAFSTHQFVGLRGCHFH